jgi:hypothetical protein
LSPPPYTYFIYNIASLLPFTSSFTCPRGTTSPTVIEEGFLAARELSYYLAAAGLIAEAVDGKIEHSDEVATIGRRGFPSTEDGGFRRRKRSVSVDGRRGFPSTEDGGFRVRKRLSSVGGRGLVP